MYLMNRKSNIVSSADFDDQVNARSTASFLERKTELCSEAMYHKLLHPKLAHKAVRGQRLNASFITLDMKWVLTPLVPIHSLMMRVLSSMS
jgi:hypothetical protein